MADYRDIITLEPGKRSGKPCIRGLRISMRKHGKIIDDFISPHPSGQIRQHVLHRDIAACLSYAADREQC